MTPEEQPTPISLPPVIQARVFRVIEHLAVSSNLEEIISLIIDSLRDCLAAERATVFQFDERSQELYISQAHGFAGVRFPITRGIAGEAARSRAIINVPDAWQDARFNPEFDKKTGFRTRGMLTIPLLSFDGKLQGVAQVLNKRVAAPAHGSTPADPEAPIEQFDPADEIVAKVLASQAAVALRRARLIDAEIRKNKIEGDLAVARTIQQASLPKDIPSIPGYDIAAGTTPADETGGDTFDLIDLSTLAVDGAGTMGDKGSPTNHPGVVVLMGDATGHGVGPALSVAQARAMVRMGVRLGASLDRIAVHLNAQLTEDLPPGRFITAFIGHLRPGAHEIEYVAPGQAPLVIVRAEGTLEETSANAMPLGIDPDLGAEHVQPLRLNPGDVFLLLSDGYYEAMDPEGEQFGMDRTLAAVASTNGGTAAEILAALNEATKVFARGRPFGDDQTAVIVKRVKA